MLSRSSPVKYARGRLGQASRGECAGRAVTPAGAGGPLTALRRGLDTRERTTGGPRQESRHRTSPTAKGRV